MKGEGGERGTREGEGGEGMEGGDKGDDCLLTGTCGRSIWNRVSMRGPSSMQG